MTAIAVLVRVGTRHEAPAAPAGGRLFAAALAISQVAHLSEPLRQPGGRES